MRKKYKVQAGTIDNRTLLGADNFDPNYSHFTPGMMHRGDTNIPQFLQHIVPPQPGATPTSRPSGNSFHVNNNDAVDYFNYGLSGLDALSGFISNNRLRNDEYINLLKTNSVFSDNPNQSGTGEIPAYTKYGGKYKFQRGGQNYSIVDYLDSIGMNSSYGNRKSYFADLFGNEPYKGTASQNIRLLTAFKKNPSYIDNTGDTVPGFEGTGLATVGNQNKGTAKIVLQNKKTVPLDAEAQNYWNIGVQKPHNSILKATVGDAKSKALGKADFRKDINLESGIVVDKRTGKAFVIKNNKAINKFNVLTGVNVNKNQMLETFKEVTDNPNLRATPTGLYRLGKPVGEPGSKGEYQGNFSPMYQSDYIGFDKPQINRHLRLGMHQTYDPQHRNKLYGSKTPYKSFGCTNCSKADYTKYVRNMPQNDSVFVVDSNVPEHLDLLNRLEAKKYGGKYTLALPEFPYGGGPLTAEGAKEILRDGKVHGKLLTAKQKRYFGYIAGGGKPKHSQAGGEDQVQQMIQQCIQELQQGKQPQEILQELAQAGVPQQQGVQIIKAAASQLQQGGSDEQEPQGQPEEPEYMFGGCDDCGMAAGGKWIQGAIKHPGRCAHPGDSKCPKGSPQYNLAMRFKHGDLHKQLGGDVLSNAKLVNSVPEDYVFAGEEGNKKYYNRTTQQLLTQANSYKGKRSGQDYENFLIQQLNNGVSPEELAGKKYISKANINKYSQFYRPNVDYVYTQPNPVNDPAQGFNGEVVYNPSNNHALGKIRYITRNSDTATDAGSLSSPQQDVQFMYVDNMGNIDNSRGMYQVPGDIWSNKISRGVKAVYDEKALNQYKKKAGGIATTHGLPDDLDYLANVNAEEGEVFQTQNGGISKVAEGSGTHSQGGVDLAGVDRVLEDTADKRKDRASKALKMSADEVEQMFGFRPKSSLTHSKAFEQVRANIDKFRDKVNKANQRLNKRENFDRYAYNAANQNYNVLDSLPTEDDVFNALFAHQENLKQSLGIKDNGAMKKFGGRYKVQAGTPGRNDPNRRSQAIGTGLDVNGVPIPLEEQGATGEPVMPDTGINGDVNINNNVSNPFFEPTHWYDLAPSVASLVDSMSRESELFNPVTFNQVRFRRANPTAVFNANQGDFNAALDVINRPDLGSGVERANVANLLGQKYRINNEVMSQYENANTQIANNEEAYNANIRDKQNYANAQARGEYFGKVQLSRENQRLQKLKAIEDLTRVMQLKARQNRSGNLVMKLSPHFNQYGEYDGLQYVSTLPPEYQMPEIPMAQTTQKTTLPNKTVITQKRGDKTIRTEQRY